MPSQTFFSLNEEKQDIIYNAALRIFTHTAFEKVSIQSIVEEANIPRGSFYQYFSGKEDLFLYLYCKVCQKIVLLTYNENMDFLWNMLYEEHPEERSSAPWYQRSLEHIKGSLTDTEYNFILHHPLPPDNLLELAAAADITTFYPLLLQHIQNDDLVNTQENAQLLAFLFSSTNLLSFEYRKLMHYQPLEEFSSIRKILLAFYDAVRKENSPFLHSYASFHLINANGMDLSFSLKPAGNSIISTIKENGVSYLHFCIKSDSLVGKFPLVLDSASVKPDFISDSDFASDTEDQFFLEIQEQKLLSCYLYAKKHFYDLGNSFTLIGTELTEKKKVLIENGILV